MSLDFTFRGTRFFNIQAKQSGMGALESFMIAVSLEDLVTKMLPLYTQHEFHL